MSRRGIRFADGWAFDSDGVPTTDPVRALVGLIRPIGDFKGVGLAMITGILSSLLSGAGYGLESGNMIEGAKAGADGQFFLALDVAAFEEVERFKARIDGVVRQVHESRRATGVERLYVPGEMESDYATDRRLHGIPLNERTLADIAEAARGANVPVPTDWQ